MSEIVFVLLGTVVFGVLLSVYRNRSPSIFCAKVSGALYELGLQPMKFNSALNKIFLTDCNAYHKINGGDSNPYDFASQFYLKAILEYSAFAEPATLNEDVLLRPISVVREWRVNNKIGTASEEHFTNKIKTALFESVEEQDMSDVMKMTTKIQILEL
jgi:hypothetical protein